MPSMPASVEGDAVIQTPPAHCHQAHPAPPAPPIPVPVPPLPPLTVVAGAKKVKIGGKPATLKGDKTKDCMLVCVKPKGGPGVVAVASTKVKIEGKFAARILDTTKHDKCMAPPPAVPAPTGKILGPGVLTVLIG